jgi:hypothetical protein
MEFCVKCGRPRKEALGFCTGCGSRFEDRNPDPAPTEHTNRTTRKTSRVALLGIASVVMLAGIGVGVFLFVNHKTADVHGAALSGNERPLSRVTTRASATPSAVPTAIPSAAPAPGAVTLGAAVVDDPQASSVANFIGAYFSAINSRDYQGYMSLFTTQDRSGLGATQFAHNYSSTTDSAETLTGLSVTANGDIAAAVTFTSHQTAAESVTGTQTCTDWSVSFYLAQNGDGYLIDVPPSDYHAAYTACSNQ